MKLDPIKLASAGGELTAELIPAAGMLCSSLRHRGTELLAQQNGVAAYAALGETMAIPLLYPWANRLAGYRYQVAGRNVELARGSPLLATDGNDLPIHGVIPANMRWDLDAVSRDAASASLSWEQPQLLAVFPFAHRANYHARLTEHSLTITLTLTAGEVAVPACFGFHPYLTIDGTERAEWVIALPVTERLILDANMIPTGSRERVRPRSVRVGDTSWDDAFTGFVSPHRFTVNGAGRAITVEFLSGYDYAQVYSPAGSQFVCFEPVTSPTNALASGDSLAMVPAGGSYRASFRVETRVA